MKRPGRPMTARRAARRALASSRPEYDHTTLDIRRITRVTSGGRRLSFSAAVIVGNRNGRVGLGVASSVDTVQAIEKALARGKKNIVNIPITDKKTIKAPVQAKYCASEVMLRPSKGVLIAGGAVRRVVEFAGITSINAKLLSRSKNHINNARATIKALRMLIK